MNVKKFWWTIFIFFIFSSHSYAYISLDGDPESAPLPEEGSYELAYDEGYLDFFTELIDRAEYEPYEYMFLDACDAYQLIGNTPLDEIGYDYDEAYSNGYTSAELDFEKMLPEINALQEAQENSISPEELESILSQSYRDMEDAKNKSYQQGYDDASALVHDSSDSDLLVPVILIIILSLALYHEHLCQRKLKKKIHNLEAQLSEYAEQNSTLEQTFNSETTAMSDTLIALQNENRELNASLSRAITELKNKNGRMQALQRENTHLQTLIHNKDSHIHDLTSKLSKSYADLSALQKPLPFRRSALWDFSVHFDSAQLKRFLRAKTEPIKIIESHGDYVTIRGTSGKVYQTTFTSCTCKDFITQPRKCRPCKHIYFLALQMNIPIEKFFPDEDFQPPKSP